MSATQLPPSGAYIKSVSESSRRIREKAGITVSRFIDSSTKFVQVSLTKDLRLHSLRTLLRGPMSSRTVPWAAATITSIIISASLRRLARISQTAVKRLLFSPSFTTSYERLRDSHGMSLPLKFPSTLAELNLLCVMSLLNFASGYRVPLHVATGRGAFDSIRAFVFTMYITADAEGDYLSARGMQRVEAGKIAELMGVADKIHQEKDHESIPGLKVGQLGGPMWELVELITKVLHETGDVLVRGGYLNLGVFVLEALKEGEKAKAKESSNPNASADVILERLVRAIPAYQDMAVIDGEPVYCFKKALLTIHAVAARFGTASPPPFPLPPTSDLPVFSDNVLPSLLVHLGVIDLTTSHTAYGLTSIFADASNSESIETLLALPPPSSAETTASGKKIKVVPKEGPILSTTQAFVLRAAAIDACNLIVETARNLSIEEITALAPEGAALAWIKDITLPGLDAWIWSVAKDREDYRRLERFVLRGTPYF
ncbi:hypothetical protein BXZ70DRAFT_1012631 [Cristinia sonorae]|uniref:Queuosine 5'-phosphate N-glycosylase/hydrolase n=1 Tax=Cristinia sonorae TaxID=1940300 RepID=A0A8K0UGD1_9AGAR|nr:hypothetical protein BXZ70DRAFT_1012631 [Cristinia sonorae]